MVVINPKYQFLESRILALPESFSKEGTLLYDARNQIRLFSIPSLNGDIHICVKRFHRPRFLNRLIYGCLRDTKAKRSYENGVYLLEHGIGTPEPIAYIEERHCGLLGYSYLVTLQSQLTRLNREWTLNYTPELENTIRPLAQFTAKMHNEGILHYDYSPGNILWDKVGDEYRFEVIDINRMRIGHPVSMKEGAKSLRRLCAKTTFFHTFADEYAKVRGINQQECTQWILYYRDLFWQHGKKAQYDYE